MIRAATAILDRPATWWRLAVLLGAVTLYLAVQVAGDLRRGVRQPPSETDVRRAAAAMLACRAARRTEPPTPLPCRAEFVQLAKLLEVHKPRDLRTGVYVSRFNLYVLEDALVYRRLDCKPEDIAFDLVTLNVHAKRPLDLPADRRPHGFVSLDFSFMANGGLVDGVCLAAVRLPAWSFERLITGHFVRGVGYTWLVDVRP